MTESRATGRLESALTGVGAILVAFAVLMLVEYLAVAGLYRQLLAGTWETAAIRTYVMPVAFGILVPTAIAMRLLAALVARAVEDPIARRLAAALAFAFGAIVAWSLSSGRRLAAPPIRMSFVLATAMVAGILAFTLLPRIARWKPSALAGLGAGVAVAAWCVDAFVLPRLYPALHAAAFLACLAGAALAAIAVPTRARLGRGITFAMLAIAGVCLATARGASVGLASYDNLRLVLIERAPLLGRAVRLAASLAPPREAGRGDEGIVSTPALTAPDGMPALDLRGHDVLLVSIDALRADHVGAYGYERATTPNIDRLARAGVRFTSAFCATPHTSYSVTSMMTGKYMRPLLALGLGEDSDTWAGLLRKYGYHTAAFYPPAVFFIDEARFEKFRDRGLDFEYRKVEFAAPDLRVRQVDEYLARTPTDQPLFLWVHLFEPHEPYVMHPDHRFGDATAPKAIDAYDSEIAAADGALGLIVEEFRKQRPRAVIIATADHGEEFGDHGGRYHGTTVYDEQVRVPLVVVAPGVAPRVETTTVQTIDLLPTMLSALAIPRPARLRGRDLGPLLAAKRSDAGFAFAETDDYTLVAEGTDRLVCERRVQACTLYDAKADPGETRDTSRERAAIAERLRARGTELARSHGRFEQGSSAGYPEALRRALQGERDAAIEIAPLLDDARLELRRATARALTMLHVIDTAPFLARAFGREEDEDTRRWLALALVRMGKTGADAGTGGAASDGPRALTIADSLLGDATYGFAAALAFAEVGDARGAAILGDHVGKVGQKGELGFDEARDAVHALGALKDRRGVAGLERALGDVRLRPLAAEALASIGDPAARQALLKSFETERYVSMRAPEARALIALGARAEIGPTLTRFAGVPEPWPEAMDLAQAAGLATPVAGDGSSARIPADASGAPRRVYVALRPLTLTTGPDAGVVAPELRVGSGLRPAVAVGRGWVFELEAGEGAALASSAALAPMGALWVVPRAAELPPPPPVPWPPPTATQR